MNSWSQYDLASLSATAMAPPQILIDCSTVMIDAVLQLSVAQSKASFIHRVSRYSSHANILSL